MSDYAAACKEYQKVLAEEYDKPADEFNARRVREAHKKMYALKPVLSVSEPVLKSTMLVPVMEKMLRTEGETEEEQHPGESDGEKRARRETEHQLLDDLCSWLFTQCTDDKGRVATIGGITFKYTGVCRCYNFFAKREGAPDDTYVCINLFRD
jgi:hypothetical protein